YRSCIYFKNTVIKPDFEIKEVELVLTVYEKPVYKDFDVVIQRGLELEDGVPVYPSQPPVVGDYNRFLYGLDGGRKNTSEMGEKYSLFTIEMNELGLSWINKEMNGITKFVLRSGDDLAGIPPAMIENRKESCSVYSGNTSRTRRRPYLHFKVTVYIP
ncbi:unnamed protein product, partial [marine sediment metagenome]